MYVCVCVYVCLCMFVCSILRIPINYVYNLSYYIPDICKCVPKIGDLQQSSVVDICIGAPVKPCICDGSNCRVSYVYFRCQLYLTGISHNSVMKKDMLEMA